MHKVIYWIIGRLGEFDGLSLLAKEWSSAVKDFGIHPHFITGNEAEKYGKIDYNGKKHFVKELYHKHPVSKDLCERAYETNSRKQLEWIGNSIMHKNNISSNIESIIAEHKDAPVIIHNMISLKHWNPTAAMALKDIIENHKDRKFVSFAADSDWEREKKISDIHETAKRMLSQDKNKTEEFANPYNYPNLYHLVLNKKQKEKCINEFGITEEQIMDIPDFMKFDSEELILPKSPEPGFIEYLDKNCIFLENDELRYKKAGLNKDTVYFLCPVRPIERKKIRTTIFLAEQFQNSTGKDAAVIITHPNGDDFTYFKESVNFANRCNVKLSYLGESLKISKGNNNDWTLDDVYHNTAALNSIGLVLSPVGGWENAINELLKAGLPVVMNPKLNSYPQITGEMGLDVFSLDLNSCYDIIDKGYPSNGHKDCRSSPEIERFTSWANKYTFHNNKRKEHINREYKKAYKSISTEAMKPKIQEFLNMIE